MNNQPKGDGWHLDKRVQISHLVATVVAAVTVLSYVFTLRQDIELLKAEQARQEQRDERQDNEARRAVGELRSYLTRIEDKLDRVTERLAAQRSLKP